jgi:hypothetical protein
MSADPTLIHAGRQEEPRMIDTAEPATPARKARHRCKPVAVIAPNGQIFGAVIDASRETGLAPSTISYRCQRGLAGWKYASEPAGTSRPAHKP